MIQKKKQKKLKILDEKKATPEIPLDENDDN